MFNLLLLNSPLAIKKLSLLKRPRININELDNNMFLPSLNE